MDPDKPEEVAAGVRDLVFNANKLKKMGEAARVAAPDYDKVKELQKFVDLLSELAAGK